MSDTRDTKAAHIASLDLSTKFVFCSLLMTRSCATPKLVTLRHNVLGSKADHISVMKQHVHARRMPVVQANSDVSLKWKRSRGANPRRSKTFHMRRTVAIQALVKVVEKLLVAE